MTITNQIRLLRQFMLFTVRSAFIIGAAIIPASSAPFHHAFRTYPVEMTPDMGIPRGMTQDVRGTLWLWGTNGVVLHTGTGFEHITVDRGLPDNYCYNIVEAPNGDIYFCTARGLAYWNALIDSIYMYPVHEGMAVRDIQFIDDQFFVAWDGGVDLVRGYGCYRVVLPDTISLQGLELMAHDLDLDEENGRLWIATDRAGIFSVEVDSLTPLILMKNPRIQQEYEATVCDLNGECGFDHRYPGIRCRDMRGLWPLTVLTDPFLVAEYYRHGKQIHGDLFTQYPCDMSYFLIEDSRVRYTMLTDAVCRYGRHREDGYWDIPHVAVTDGGSVYALSPGRVFHLADGGFIDRTQQFEAVPEGLVEARIDDQNTWHILGESGCVIQKERPILAGRSTGLSSNEIPVSLVDRQGICWFVEASAGKISRLSLSSLKIYHGSEWPLLRDIGSVVTILPDRWLLIGDNGISLMDSLGPRSLLVSAIPHGIRDAAIDLRGNIILASDYRLYRLNVNAGTLSPLTNNLPRHNGFVKFDIGKDGRVWIALSGVLYSWDGDGLSIIPEMDSHGKPHRVLDVPYYSLFTSATPDSGIFVGSWMGLYRLLDHELTYYMADRIIRPDSSIHTLTRGTMADVFSPLCGGIGPDGAFWTGTFRSGIVRIKGDSVVVYDSEDGIDYDHYSRLANGPEGALFFAGEQNVCIVDENGPRMYYPDLPSGVSIVDLAIDDSGREFYATSRGLFIQDGIRRYLLDLHFGLPESPVLSVTLLPGAGIMAVKPNGIFIFDPETVECGDSPIEPRITSFICDSNRMAITPEIIPDSGKRSFRILFTLNDFICEEHNRYSWKLEGLDDGFSKPTDQNTAIYERIPPGKYRFHLHAWNGFGRRSELSIPLGITIPAYFYETGIFRAGVAFLLLILVLLLVRGRMHRIRAERALRLSEDQYRSMIENAAAAVVVIDEDFRVQYANNRFLSMLGYTDGDSAGRVFTEFLHPDDVENVEKEFISIHHENRESKTEFRFLRRDGVTGWAEAYESSFPARTAKKQMLIQIMDITDRKRAEIELRTARDEAESATRAKSQFLANMSHEIRTPLNAILGFSEILEEEILDESQKSYVAAITAGGKSLLGVINDILDLSKIEAGRLEIHPKSLRLRALFSEVHQLLEQNALSKGLELRYEMDPSLPDSVLMDDVRIRQIIVNLVGNAIKFTKEGFVCMAVHAGQRSLDGNSMDIHVTVADSGMGIADQECHSIFEPFHQQKGVDTRLEGTGLGLTITKRLVDAMGGTIEVESQVDVGSIFHVIFPDVTVTRELSPDDKGDHIKKKLIFRPAKILIVDDIRSSRELVRSFLADTDLEIIDASSGEEGIEQAKHHRPDLIIMDLILPGMSGFEAVKVLRSDPDTGAIPIVAVSASIQTETEENAREHGCEEFIPKPFTRRRLGDVLSRFLPYDVYMKSSERRKESDDSSES